MTRDKAIRRRAAGQAAVRDGGAYLFALTSGNLSAAETAAIVVAAWPRICAAVASTPAPAFFAVLRSGIVRIIKP